jgi:DNA-directed RNA polymerase subunit L
MSLTIKELEYEKNEYMESYLKLDIRGDNVSYETINALRKICMNQIPIYAFNQENIKIIKNTSIFDNTYCKHRLSLITIKDLNDYNDEELKIEYYGNYENIDDINHIDILENDVIKTINGESIIKKYEHSATIVQLNLTQSFEFSMIATKNIGEHNAIYNASHVYYEYDDDNNFIMTIESYGQYTEYILLNKACDIIIEKFKIIKETINQNENTISFDNEKSIILNISNEDLTTFGPIKYFLLQSDNVIYAGNGRHSGFLIKNVSLKIKTTSNTTPFDEIYKAINKCITFYELFKNTLNNKKNNKTDEKIETIKKTKKAKK